MEQSKHRASGDDQLDLEDCHDIIKELAPVADRWYEIGFFLGLTYDSLNKLKALAIGENDFTKLLLSMIAEWLKLCYNTIRFGMPTWRRIVEAVGADTGGKNPALADGLARKYRVTTQVSQPVQVMATPPSTEAMPTPPKVPIGTCCCCFSSGPSSSGSQVSNGTTTYVSPSSTGKSEIVSVPVKFTGEVLIPRRFSVSNRQDSCSNERSASNNLESSRDTILAHPTWEIEEITQQEGYCGAMTGKEAEQNLRSFGGNCYLLRYSKRQEKYVITVLLPDTEPAITDYTISIRKRDNSRVYEIEGTQKDFPSITELLEFYQNTPLTRSNRTIGKAYSKPSVQAYS